MANPQFIQYGDKKMPMPADMTLETAKSVMANYFPELAEPKVEKKELKGETIYVFSKQMGKKGSDAECAAVAAKIARARRAESVPAEWVELLGHATFAKNAWGDEELSFADVELSGYLDGFHVRNERYAVQCAIENLLALVPQMDAAEQVILL